MPALRGAGVVLRGIHVRNEAVVRPHVVDTVLDSVPCKPKREGKGRREEKDAVDSAKSTNDPEGGGVATYHTHNL